MISNLDLDPDLARKLNQIGKRCERRRQQAAFLRFAGFSLLITSLVSAGLTFLEHEWGRNLVMFVYLAAELAAFLRWLRPLYLHPLSDEQIALFIDEHYPELENRIVSMVAMSENARGHSNSWMIRRFLKESQAFVRASPLVYHDRFSFGTRHGTLIAGMLLMVPLIMLQFAEVWMPRFPLKWANQQEWAVEPGDAKVRFGEALTVFVTHQASQQVTSIAWRFEGGSWQETPMQTGEADGTYYHSYANIQETTYYRIKQGSERTRTYTITPWLPPEIQAIDLTYHYPEYLERPPREAPNGGDITAIEGTRVQIEAHTNKPLAKLEMKLEQAATTISFKRIDEQLWRGSLTVTQSDSYRLQPIDHEGGEALYQASYLITAREDKPPQIRVDFPYRDMEVSALDEVEFEFTVSDDFELDDYGIRYQVADRTPEQRSLKKQQSEQKLSTKGKHRLMLESLKLEPGDVLTWAIWATDRKPERDEFDQMGDPFFLEIRPFRRTYREAVSDSGNLGGAGGGGGDLVVKQKQVLIATWNLRKEQCRLEDAQYQERLKTINTTQLNIRELVGDPMAETMSKKPEYPKLLEALDAALATLDEARTKEQALQALSKATEHEQRAYRMLLRLDPTISQVNRNQGPGGGEAARQKQDINELEMERNRNFYEEEHHTKQQQQEAAQALDQIKELAQRQQMVNEEIAKLISEIEQQQIDEQEAKRRLERLQEEARKNVQKLDKIRRQINTSEIDPTTAQNSQRHLDEARQRMNQELESMQPDRLQDARASGGEALRNLDQLKQDLEKQTRGSARQRVADLQQQMAEMQEKQRGIRDQIAQLGETKDSPRLTAEDPKQTLKTELIREKEEQQDRFKALMEDAAAVSNMTRGDQTQLSRKLGDWLRRTSRQGIGEEMEEATDMARFGVWDGLEEKEKQVAQELDQAASELDKLAHQMAGDELETRRQALAELQELQKMSPGTKSGRMTAGQEQMEKLASEEYRDWQEHLRNAEALLGESQHSGQLLRMRRAIEKMRRSYKNDNLIPKYELFEKTVLKPLNQTVSRLEKEVKAIGDEREFVLADDGSVPETYRRGVAEYFELLSATEDN